jgi:hypothetical protein
MNGRVFNGINNNDVKSISPDSFRFHGPMKALFYRLLKLINPPPKEWLDDVSGNMAVLREIYDEYLQHEKQAWRRDVLTRAIPFSLCLANYDENYEEVVQWFLYRIIQEQNLLHFTYENRTPACWFQDGRGRIGLSKENRKIAEEMNYVE